MENQRRHKFKDCSSIKKILSSINRKRDQIRRAYRSPQPKYISQRYDSAFNGSALRKAFR